MSITTAYPGRRETSERTEGSKCHPTLGAYFVRVSRRWRRRRECGTARQRAAVQDPGGRDGESGEAAGRGQRDGGAAAAATQGGPGERRAAGERVGDFECCRERVSHAAEAQDEGQEGEGKCAGGELCK